MCLWSKIELEIHSFLSKVKLAANMTEVVLFQSERRTSNTNRKTCLFPEEGDEFLAVLWTICVAVVSE